MRDHVVQDGAEDGRGVKNLPSIGNLEREFGCDRIIVEDAAQPGALGALQNEVRGVKVAPKGVKAGPQRCERRSPVLWWGSKSARRAL